MELIEVAPCRHAVFIVGIHRRRDKLIGNVHGDLAEVFSHPLDDDAHHTGIEIDIGGVIEQVEGACAVELQSGRHTAGLGLGLAQKLLIQILEQGRFRCFQPQRHFSVDQPHTAVNDGLFNGLQALLAAHHQLAQGKQKVRLHGKRAVLIADPHLNIHRVDVVGAVRGDLYNLSAQPTHQRGIFSHWVYNDYSILGDGQKHIEQFPLGGEALARAGGAEIQAVGRFQLFAVSHDDIVGKGVHAVVEGLPAHAELTGHKGNKNRRGAGGHAPLYLNAVVAEGQRGNKRLLLLPVQTL